MAGGGVGRATGLAIAGLVSGGAGPPYVALPTHLRLILCAPPNLPSLGGGAGEPSFPGANRHLMVA
jgi:hypothetical protein